MSFTLYSPWLQASRPEFDLLHMHEFLFPDPRLKLLDLGPDRNRDCMLGLLLKDRAGNHSFPLQCQILRKHGSLSPLTLYTLITLWTATRPVLILPFSETWHHSLWPILAMEATHPLETLVDITSYQTTRCHIPEECNIIHTALRTSDLIQAQYSFMQYIYFIIYFMSVHVTCRCAEGDGRCTRLGGTKASTSLPETGHSRLRMAICPVQVSFQWSDQTCC